MATEAQRVVLITGCSSGIGLAIAVMLARDEMKRYYGNNIHQRFCKNTTVQCICLPVSMSMIEPGPVHTEFEMKMFADVSKKEYVGTDPETLHHFRTCYLPSAANIFQGLGQTPEDIAKCTKKVIESPRPPFRNLTNPLYTPIVALKYADETGSLSVHTFYHMLYNLGGVMHVSLSILKCLSCGCLRRQAISPT
ncbi:retinol dehydrogenase 8-like [Sinocyclocheilus grahami]|uniref:retinol dehydrogenase 8-like n=1 Tax=Sinocyclocheilus grahami TaxID=75366 RepID=UPI0007AD0B65|nr:PREDICTED: retinol dehydrogenase 8-like [Sinocyclocheilus grahami]